jgi:hypothetical protein
MGDAAQRGNQRDSARRPASAAARGDVRQQEGPAHQRGVARSAGRARRRMRRRREMAAPQRQLRGGLRVSPPRDPGRRGPRWARSRQATHGPVTAFGLLGAIASGHLAESVIRASSKDRLQTVGLPCRLHARTTRQPHALQRGDRMHLGDLPRLVGAMPRRRKRPTPLREQQGEHQTENQAARHQHAQILEPGSGIIHATPCLQPPAAPAGERTGLRTPHPLSPTMSHTLPDAHHAGHRPSRWAVVAVVVGALLIGIFGWRAWHQWAFEARVASGEVQVDTLRGWMTLPYIARVYGVPEAELRASLGAPPSGDSQRSLREWFERTGRDPVAARRAIEILILARRSQATSTPSP